MASLRSAGSFALVLALVAACRVGASDEAGAKGAAGSLCGTSADCESNSCRLEGYCGVSSCSGDDDCPSGWTCETSKGDPLFGIGAGNTYCEPSCAACPAGTGCEKTSRCERLEPKVTVNGGPPRVGQPANLELAIDARGLPSSQVAWKLDPPADKPAPIPSSGTGTKLAVTFHAVGAHGLTVTVGGPGKGTTSTRVDLVACGDAGAECSGGEGECCGGECALHLDFGASFEDQKTLCVARCPATCAPAHSCRSFDRSRDGSLPTGEFCLPEPPVVTIDYAPKNPTVDQPVTFTATATSPAGLKVVAHRWQVNGNEALGAAGPTMTQTFGKSGTYEVTVEATDEARQRTKTKVTVHSCIPAGQSCFGGGYCCGGSTCTSSKCQ